MIRLTEHAHQILAQHLSEGDFAIDATAGNGYDTLFMARAVGTSGQVLAIDLQASAVEATRQRLADAGVDARVHVEQADHADRLESMAALATAQAAAIVFNLGYLPGSDKTIQTHPSQTLRALDASAQLLRPGGLLCVTAYRAHLGGEAEAQSVETWMRARETEEWSVECHIPPSKNLPPVLWVATKP